VEQLLKLIGLIKKRSKNNAGYTEIDYSKEYKDVRKLDKLIELIERNTENMKDWPEWKREISLLETVNGPTIQT